jgi:hypothetical protein
MSIDDKLGRILENQTDQRVILATIETDLRHHIKRSDQHEKDIKLQNKTITRLWLAVALLAGAGAGSTGPSIVKFIGSIL